MLDFIATVYSFFGMEFALKLSTKPECALGDAADVPRSWRRAAGAARGVDLGYISAISRLYLGYISGIGYIS